MPFGRRRAISLPVRIPRQENAVDACLANAPRDQLAVLAAEIEHYDGVEAGLDASLVPGSGDRRKRLKPSFTLLSVHRVSGSQLGWV